VIERLIDDAEAQYRNFQHPDPYIGKLCSGNPARWLHFRLIMCDVTVSV
jgi:hypothetical protein